jgi:hypothetical protein
VKAPCVPGRGTARLLVLILWIGHLVNQQVVGTGPAGRCLQQSPSFFAHFTVCPTTGKRKQASYILARSFCVCLPEQAAFLYSLAFTRIQGISACLVLLAMFYEK